MSVLENMKAAMAASATGWGAIINGTLDVRTVTDSANGAATNAIYAKGVRLITNCTEPDCDCKVKLLADLFPDVKIVSVKVEVSNV